MSTTYEEYREYIETTLSPTDTNYSLKVNNIFQEKISSDSIKLTNMDIDADGYITFITIEDKNNGNILEIKGQKTDPSDFYNGKVWSFVSLGSQMYLRMYQQGTGVSMTAGFDIVIFYNNAEVQRDTWNIYYGNNINWKEFYSLQNYFNYQIDDDALNFTFNQQAGAVSVYEDVSEPGHVLSVYSTPTTLDEVLANITTADGSRLLVGKEYEFEESKYPYRDYYFTNKTFNNGNVIRNIDGRIISHDVRLAGYLSDNMPYNINIVGLGEVEYSEDGGAYTTVNVSDLPKLTSNDTIGNYFGLLSTNIPLYTKSSDALAYIATGYIGEPINAADIEDEGKTGKDGTIARFERANTYRVTSSANRIMDITGVNSRVMSWMRSLNDPTISETINMFWWTNNPIECVIAYYWTPLNISSLCFTNPHVSPYVRFGGVLAEDDEGTIIATQLNIQGSEKLLGQYQFYRKYNDWRDYELFSYKLYLPFYGIVELEPYFVIGRRLEVKYVYYPSNHMIHYMIFVKQNLYKEFDCSIGVDLPMTSSDAVGKANQMFTDATRMAEGLGETFGGALTGNVGGVVSGASNVIGSAISMEKKASFMGWGCINSTSNIGDPLQALLFIEEQKCIIPDKLHELYGYATYYIGSVGSLSGYCEFSDVRLETSATPDEKNQIISMMRQGIII